jgi:N-methylhydantoinase B
VFFHNDVHLSEGGIGHLPDLCVTAPVFAPLIARTERSEGLPAR